MQYKKEEKEEREKREKNIEKKQEEMREECEKKEEERRKIQFEKDECQTVNRKIGRVLGKIPPMAEGADVEICRGFGVQASPDGKQP